MRGRKWIRWALGGLGGLGAAALGTVLLYTAWERPPVAAAQPELWNPETETPAATAPAKPTAESGKAFDTHRQDGVYTLLFAGSDDGTGNTDTIMVGKLDTVRHTANFVSIPRDTLINVNTPVRKLNSVYWGAVNNGGVGSEALLRHIKKLVGFDVDCYAVIDLEAFQRAVDALGGIWYEVPQRMYYDQGPVIDLEPGWQRLSGEQAMWLCRYRSGYVNGDIDRISVQHDFLKAAADQFLQLGKIPNVPQVAAILAQSMDTNLSAANMAWFARQLMRCKSEDIRFYTAPNTPAFVHELSYTFLDLYDWLEMINSTLNPGTAPIGEGQLDLVYLHNGEVCCTTALQGLSYFDMSRRPAPEALAEESEPEENWEMPVRTPAPAPVRTPPPPEDWLTLAETPAPAPTPDLTPMPDSTPAPAPVQPVPFLSPMDDDWLTVME